MKDTQTLFVALEDRSPFTSDPSLRNIMNGVHAQASVNVDKAKEVGLTILESMRGHLADSYSFTKSNQAVTLVMKCSVRICDEQVQVDPQLLFQRLITACKSVDDMESNFKYELCSYPPALFDMSFMPWEPQKSALADALWANVSMDTSQPPNDVQYVLDGGALLHRIPWPTGTPTYREICLLYCSTPATFKRKIWSNSDIS